jgi:capsular polysaccharide biosynthesis protein
MLMVARRPKEENKFGGTRYILNSEEVADKMEEFCTRHKIEFHKTYMEDHTPEKQIELIAQADILMAMHGSVLSLAGFQPPHSITVEVLPSEFQYCLFHHCLSHG